MNGQNSMSPIKPTSPTDVFSNENYLYETQDTELKRTAINFIKTLQKFKNDMNKHFTEL